MADQQQNPGFKLPPPSGMSESSATTSTSRESQIPVTTATSPPVLETDTGARDLAVAGGVLLVLVIAFVFAKNAYAYALVGRKVAPRSANAAGWWLFIALTSLATIAVLGFVNQARFLTLFFVVPLGLVALVSLALLLSASRR
jgi:hypothetical protein